MIRIRDIDHGVLRVRELRPRVDVCCRVLGRTVGRRQEGTGPVQLCAERARLDLIPVAGPRGRAGGAPPGTVGRNLDHSCLRRETFDEAGIRAQFAALGIDADGSAPSICLVDPEGNSVELKGPPWQARSHRRDSARLPRPANHAVGGRRPDTQISSDLMRCGARR
jgi:glyoxylase I family protein